MKTSSPLIVTRMLEERAIIGIAARAKRNAPARRQPPAARRPGLGLQKHILPGFQASFSAGESVLAAFFLAAAAFFAAAVITSPV